MKKSLRVLSAILVASFAFANVVSAEISVEGADKQATSFDKLLGMVEHKATDTKAFYESLIDEKVEAAALKELTAAYGKFESDVKKVSEYSVALCAAKKELINLDKEIKKAALYTQVAGKLVAVTVQANTTKAGVEVSDSVKYMFKEDLEALNKMDKEYTDAKEVAESTNILGATVAAKTKADVQADITKKAKELVNKVVAYQAEAAKAFTFEAKNYEKTLADLRTKAALASAKIKLIQEFGKRLNVTFTACEFEDPFVAPKATEDKKAEEAKKDSVPNTAAFNFFPQLPTTCSYAIVSEGQGCCKTFKVVKACDLKKGEKTVAMTYAQLAEYSIPALACSCK